MNGSFSIFQSNKSESGKNVINSVSGKNSLMSEVVHHLQKAKELQSELTQNIYSPKFPFNLNP